MRWGKRIFNEKKGSKSWLNKKFCRTGENGPMPRRDKLNQGRAPGIKNPFDQLRRTRGSFSNPQESQKPLSDARLSREYGVVVRAQGRDQAPLEKNRGAAGKKGATRKLVGKSQVGDPQRLALAIGGMATATRQDVRRKIDISLQREGT